jgi:uncharacterized protein (TIGR02145 family)
MPLKIRVHERLDEAFNPKTVKIGNQVWMAENLAIDDGGAGIININNTYYYTEYALKRICPKGWHIPSSKEWNTAVKQCGGLLIPTYHSGYAPRESYKNIQSFVNMTNLGLDGIIKKNNPVNAREFNKLFGNVRTLDERPLVYVADHGYFGYYWTTDTDDGKIYVRQVSKTQISGILQSFEKGITARLVRD